MRTIGIDLAIQAEHKAIVMDEHGRFITPVIKFHTRPAELDDLLQRAREGATCPRMRVVMEPTGMAWFPIAAYLKRQGLTVYLADRQQVADLRRYYRRQANDDRIDVRVLARLPLVNPEKLQRLILPSAMRLACQRGCNQLDRWATKMTTVQNRIRAIDHLAWPELKELVFPDPFALTARWFRQHWYNPYRVVQANREAIRQAWCTSDPNPGDSTDWIEALVHLAEEVIALYGNENTSLDFDVLQLEVCHEQEHLAFLEPLYHTLQVKTVHPLYQQLHPSRHLETIAGVSQTSAAAYASFLGDPHCFEISHLLRSWHGVVLEKHSSPPVAAKGSPISQTGLDLIKKVASLDADAARHQDPKIAAIYYDQRMRKGKTHQQALSACATHLLECVLAVLQEDKPYIVCDVDDTPISPEQAHTVILERYTVPEEARRCDKKCTRHERADRSVEKKFSKKDIQETLAASFKFSLPELLFPDD